jgi:putative transcriptional regulator
MVTPKRKSLYERLRIGLEEGIAHAKGELNLKTVEVPQAPPEIDANMLATLREQSEMSQAVFAGILNVSTKTIQSWEQGLRKPSHASRRLIQVFSERPEVVCQVAGLSAVKLQEVKIVPTKKGGRKFVIRRPKNGRKDSESV